MSNFYFGGSSASSGRASPTNSSDFNDDSLPYPAPLPRPDFLAPDFEPSTYLSSLGHRHQTLEDLRTELRERSQLLNKELLDLVNAHYQDFLSLGSSLKGGDEKVEELRIGLLGFQRDVDEVKRKVEDKEKEVDGLLAERVRVRKDIALGRKLLDYDARLSRLEEKLMVESSGKRTANEDGSEVSDTSEDEEEDEEDEGSSALLGRLKRRVGDFAFLEHLSRNIGTQHPFVDAHKFRVMRARQTLLLDMSAALKNATSTGSEAVKLKVMGFYRDMDASKDAIEVLKASRKR